MRILITALGVGLTAHLTQTFGPWWIGAVCAFIIVLWTRPRPVHAFIAGFLGLAGAWCIAALWIDMQNHEILTSRVASMFGVTRPMVFLITIAVGGLVGGFGALTGSYAANFLNPKVEPEDRDKQPLLG